MDQGNGRVLVFDLSGAISNGMLAANVIGSTSFTGITGMPAGQAFSSPAGVAYDSVNKRLFVGDSSNSRVMVYDVSAGITNGQSAVRVLGQPDFTTTAVNTTQTGMNILHGLSFDDNGQRLFVADGANNRYLVFNLSGGITDGMAASFVIGKPDFTTNTGTLSQSLTTIARGVMYDPVSQRLFVPDVSNSRIMIFDVSAATGTTSSTLTNKATVSRLAAGASSTFSLSFTLTHNLSSVLTVTFPAGFTVTSAAATADSSSCLSNFTYDSLHLYAQKTNCAGPITLGGATITNPSTPGTYKIFYVNDDPGFISISVTADDQITVAANVDPSLSFNVGTQASATACSGSFSGNGGTFALGVLSSGAVTSSDAATVDHLCTRVSTNATGGAAVTVRSLNAGLKTTSASADVIASATGALVSGTPGYGLCVGSGVGDTGKDATTPVGASPSAVSPFASTCSTSAHNVGGLTASAQNLWTLATSAQNAFARLFLKAAISGTTPP